MVVDNVYTERLKKSASDRPSKKWEIRHYLKPGNIGYLTYLHASYIQKNMATTKHLKRMLLMGLQNSFNP